VLLFSLSNKIVAFPDKSTSKKFVGFMFFFLSCSLLSYSSRHRYSAPHTQPSHNPAARCKFFLLLPAYKKIFNLLNNF